MAGIDKDGTLCYVNMNLPFQSILLEISDGHYSGVFWKSIGDAMEISYVDLPSAKDGWRDGLHWLKDIEDWSQDYEAKHMVPADTNSLIAKGTVNLLLYDLPAVFRGPGEKVMVAVLDERLRKAMKYVTSKSDQNLSIELSFSHGEDCSTSIDTILPGGQKARGTTSLF